MQKSVTGSVLTTFLALAVLPVAISLLAGTAVSATGDGCDPCTVDVNALNTDPSRWSVVFLIDPNEAHPGPPFGQTQAANPTDSRGLAASPDNLFLYVGYNNSFNFQTGGEVRKINATTGATVKVLPDFRGKAIATDDKGRVYLAEGIQDPNIVPPCSSPHFRPPIAVYDADLNAISGGQITDVVAPEGLDVVRDDATTLTLWASDRCTGLVRRYSIVEGTGTAISSITLVGNPLDLTPNGAVSLRGVEVDASGRVWVADPSAGLSPGQVFIIDFGVNPPTVQAINVEKALDLGFDATQVLVTQFTKRTITVLKQDLTGTPVVTAPPWGALAPALDPNGYDSTQDGVDDGTLSGIVVACGLFYVVNGAGTTADQMKREPVLKAMAASICPAPETTGKVTGGGHIPVAGGTGTANYGFNVQRKTAGDPVKGQLEYHNHATGQTYHSVTMTSLSVTSITCTGGPGKEAVFKGTIKHKQTGNLYDFTATVRDCGEPGRGADTFGIAITGSSDGSAATVIRGNIQVHN